MGTVQSIADMALKLGPVEKAELIELLFGSFETTARETIDHAWAGEVEKRIDAFEAGELKADSAEYVFGRLGEE